MKRREFIAGLGGAAAWPLAARAQQDARVRRLGVLLGWSERDPEFTAQYAGFVQALAGLGWIEGRNLRIDLRWKNAQFARIAPLAKELVALQPDVILSSTTPVTTALHRETDTIPIVFAVVSDPVGAGLVNSLSRPGGNVTGFINIEGAMGGKWLVHRFHVSNHITWRRRAHRTRSERQVPD
jgi:putative ABC transport system substrate-binding protein